MKKLALVLAVLGVLTGCGSAADGAPAPEPPLLLLTFDEQPTGTAVSPVMSNNGRATTSIDVVRAGAGRVRFEARDGEGLALALPAYSGAKNGAYAGVRVAGESWLSPGEQSFEFGADVRLDAKSMGSKLDNGDNVVQRGLFADAAQFKIQVDKRRPSCVLRGSGGALVVKSDVTLGNGWYRLRCRREGADRVTLSVTDLARPDAAPDVAASNGPLGAITMDSGVPMSIGVKLGDDGHLVVSATDQFNGGIDNVFFTVDSS